jgi:SgrR family transcriptional regulator
LLVFCQEFPFYAFRSSATTVYPPLAVLRGQSQETTLNELADLLSCSRRHMRTLLNTMQQQGWLGSGGGTRQTLALTFLYTGLACSSSARKICWSRIASISWCSWWATKPPCARCWFPSRAQLSSGPAHSAGALLPSDEKSAARQRAARSETHMARQIFSALTRVNEENGELEADIAHHWQQLTPTHWRFFYAPASIFTTAVSWKWPMSSPLCSAAMPCRSTHISNASNRPPPGRWIFICRSPTAGCPGCWACAGDDAAAGVGIDEQFSSHAGRHRALRRVRNNKNQLKIRAFDDYLATGR